jgi:chromosome segregation ATPase
MIVRPTCHTSSSVGRLVSISVDNPQYYTAPASSIGGTSSSPPPPLIPIASAGVGSSAATNNDNEEKTMLWRNIANLFAKYEDIECTLQDHKNTTTRFSDEVYQELKDVKSEIEQSLSDFNENNVLSKHVRKLRKYVNKKCEQVKQDVSYGSSCADNEIFAYIDTLRTEFDARTKALQDENTRLREEMSELNDTYYRDYEMFVQRENDLLAKLDDAVNMSYSNNTRLRDLEDTFMRQIQKVRDDNQQMQYNLAGDMREEFAHAITKEVEFESKTSAQLVQSVHDELFELVTRSNEYHSHRYFGLVEDIKQVRENCVTLKQSIGMVDAELSDVKENIEHLTDEVGQNTTDTSNLTEDLHDLREDVYREMDRDYYDLKDYTKRQMNRHHKKHHAIQVQERPAALEQNHVIDDATALGMNVEPQPEPQPQPQARPAPTEHLIIIDENTFMSDDDEDDFAPQV